MRKIINRKKYDTETAWLLAVYRNKHLKKFEKEIEDWFGQLVIEPVEDLDPGFGVDHESQEPQEETDIQIYSTLMNSISKSQEPEMEGEEKEDDEDDSEEQEPEDNPDEEDEDPEPEEPALPEPETVPDYRMPYSIGDIVPSPFWSLVRLYQKKSTGEYFIAGCGGVFSGWHTSNLNRPEIKNFYEMDPVTKEWNYSEKKALDWAIDHLSIEDVERIFGEIEE